MKTNKLFLIAALLGTVLAGCQKVSEIQNPEEKPENNQTWTLKVLATKDVDTRALNYDGNTTMKPYWKNGEEVSVLFDGEKIGTLTVTSESQTTPATPATLEGTVTADGLSEGAELTLLFPGRPDDAWTYLGQTGVLPEPYDYAIAALQVASLDAATQTINVSSESVRFANQQSIYRFSFKVGGEGNGIPVKSFIVASEAGKLVRSRAYENSAWTSVKGNLFVNTTSATAPYLMSIRNENTAADKYTFSVVGSNNELYIGEKALTGVINGKFYNATVSVTQKTFTTGTGSIESADDVL